MVKSGNKVKVLKNVKHYNICEEREVGKDKKIQSSGIYVYHGKTKMSQRFSNTKGAMDFLNDLLD